MIHIIWVIYKKLILAQAVLNGDVDPLEVQDEDLEDDDTEELADDEGGIRDELWMSLNLKSLKTFFGQYVLYRGLTVTQKCFLFCTILGC